MYKFKVGDKVRCIDSGRQTEHKLTLNAIYTILDSTFKYLYLSECGFSLSFRQARFKIVEKVPIESHLPEWF